jgi:hypothetical protein
LDPSWRAPALKTKATKLLSIVACFSEQAHNIALEALKRERPDGISVYQRLVQGLTDKIATPSYKVHCMALINAMVNFPLSLETRTALREEFLHWKLNDAMDVRHQKTTKD